MGANEAAEGGATSGRRFQAGADPRKRAQILAGAYRVFLAMGYDAASMNDITRESGVSKGTIYVYFRDKDELFEALLVQESERQVGELAAALDDERPVGEALAGFARHLIALSTRDDIVQVQRVIIAIAGRMPELAQRYYRKGPQAVRDLLTAYLMRAAEAGRIRVADADAVAVQFIDLTVGQLVRERQYAVVSGAPSDARIDAAVRGALDLVLPAIGADERSE